MHIISFSTRETGWRVPRMGMILHVQDHDTGYRLDCEKLFDKVERPSDPLAWSTSAMGQEAANLLLELIDGNKKTRRHRTITLPPQLIIRRSCGAN